jgi:predicted RNA polymerase sigma factor
MAQRYPRAAHPVDVAAVQLSLPAAREQTQRRLGAVVRQAADLYFNNRSNISELLSV